MTVRSPMPTDTCAFLPCDQVDECCLVGGCVRKRFPQQFTRQQSTLSQEPIKKGQKALNGTKPGRASSKRKV